MRQKPQKNFMNWKAVHQKGQSESTAAGYKWIPISKGTNIETTYVKHKPRAGDLGIACYNTQSDLLYVCMPTCHTKWSHKPHF